ncbi:MAG: hypothetical protein AB1449_00630 [Chloroflexota bacterium]
MRDDEERLAILEQVERGQMSVEEALRRLEAGETAEPGSSHAADASRPVPEWWLVPFGIGLALTAAGGWMASLGGWWWLGAAPGLALGLPLMTLGAMSRNTPWLQLRLGWRDRGRRGRIRLVVPIPIRLIGWFLRFGRRWMPRLEETAIDELILALEESVRAAAPVVVEVDDDEGGEHVRVTLG